MNPNLAALLFFSPFLIMFFSFIFWIFQEERRRELQREKWDEERRETTKKFLEELKNAKKHVSVGETMKKSRVFLLSEDDLYICLKNLFQLKIIYESVLRNKKFGDVIMIENHAFLRKDFPRMIEEISETIMKIDAYLADKKL